MTGLKVSGEFKLSDKSLKLPSIHKRQVAEQVNWVDKGILHPVQSQGVRICVSFNLYSILPFILKPSKSICVLAHCNNQSHTQNGLVRFFVERQNYNYKFNYLTTSSVHGSSQK